MGAKRIVQPIDGDVATFVEDAFSDAEGLKDELESWYENLPESFQNGEKGEKLQEAISALENPSAPDVPDSVGGINCRYSPCPKRRQSRADRLSDCVSRMQEAAQAARDRVDQLESLNYNDDGVLCDDDDKPVAESEIGDDPATEEAKNTLKDELEMFADDCDEVVSEWEGVEFPGMYS